MDDILLGQKDRDALFRTRQTKSCDYSETWEEALCRAQVRKVDTVLFAPWEEKLVCSKADITYVRMIQEARQALRAAAEEARQ